MNKNLLECSNEELIDYVADLKIIISKLKDKVKEQGNKIHALQYKYDTAKEQLEEEGLRTYWEDE